MKILVLDNYDSFTYNLVHILRELGHGSTLKVVRNDKITLEEVDKFDKILLSPGPGVPADAGIMPALIKTYGATKSILGVCLGHQAIAEAYGVAIYNMPTVLHGIATKTIVSEEENILFRDIPKEILTCRYHSWSVNAKSLTNDLVVTALSIDGVIMAMRHKSHDVRGVQFHPESYLTEYGVKMIENWIKGE